MIFTFFRIFNSSYISMDKTAHLFVTRGQTARGLLDQSPPQPPQPPGGLPEQSAVENTLIKLPSGSRNNMERVPHGCSVGSITNLPTIPVRRMRSRSTLPTSKSMITD